MLRPFRSAGTLFILSFERPALLFVGAWHAVPPVAQPLLAVPTSSLQHRVIPNPVALFANGGEGSAFLFGLECGRPAAALAFRSDGALFILSFEGPALLNACVRRAAGAALL